MLKLFQVIISGCDYPYLILKTSKYNLKKSANILKTHAGL
jgi:hypothetical protein